MASFMKPKALHATDDLLDIQCTERPNQVRNKELAIGTATRMLLIEAELNGSAELERRFLTNVRLFYEATVKRIIMKFPFRDQILGNLQLLNPKARLQVSQASVIGLAKRFTAMEPDQVDVVLSELGDFMIIPDNQLPTYDSSESFWHLVGKIAMPGDTSRLQFKNLTDLIKTLLLLPHGNVDPECLFMVGKVETEQRGSLLPATVRDVISVKMNALSGTPCYQVGDKLFTPNSSGRRRTLQREASRTTLRISSRIGSSKRAFYHT